MSVCMSILVAERAVALVETRINERLDECLYCENGANAYEQADLAIRRALEDVRAAIRRADNTAAQAEAVA